MPIHDGVSVKTYCQETAKYIEKLNIPGLVTREQMALPPTEMNPSWHVQRLVAYMEHSVFCEKDRCCMYFCYSFKRIVPHFGQCCHVDCYECLRFNVLLWEHVKRCKDCTGCRIPGCKSVMRVIGWQNLMGAQEPEVFKSEGTAES